MRDQDTVSGRIKRDIARFAEYQNKVVTPTFVIGLLFKSRGFRFVFVRRVLEAVVKIPLLGRPVRRVLWPIICIAYKGEIAMGAEIGGGLYISNPTGIVIGAAKLGSDITINHRVTVGNRRDDDRQVPIIEDGVTLGVGCVVIGGITVGRASIVGEYAVVNRDVSAGSIINGVERSEIRPTSFVRRG